MITLPAPVNRYLQENKYGMVLASIPVSGGCINNGIRIGTASGKSVFLKTNTNIPADTFKREAEGLAALRAAECGLHVPEVLLVGEQFLLLEDLNPADPAPGYWDAFGEGLARLHEQTLEQYGFDADNYLGSTSQPNGWLADGWQFFGQRRLIFQAELAARNGYFSAAQVGQVERLAARLPELVPPQPASLLHGDLWRGNAISNAQGQPAIIDPAVYYGWAEAELAMTALFGGFPASFYAVYEEARPLAPGWRERFPIYNLYHLLNHLNLFGRGYTGQVMEIINHYAG